MAESATSVSTVNDARFPDPIPRIIPFGTLTIFAGAPAVGKTTLFVEWIRRWHDGRSICGHATNAPTAFYYVCADRGTTEDQFFTKLGYRDEGVFFFSVVDGNSGFDTESFTKDAHGAELFFEVMRRLNPIPGAHVIIDPIAPLFISGNQNRTRDVASSLIRMSRCLQERQINITGMAHFSKQKASKDDRYRRPQDRISGSGAFSGFSDTQMYLVDPEPPKQPYYQFGWNPRNHPPQDFKFERDDQGWFVPYHGPDEIGSGDTIVPEKKFVTYNNLTVNINQPAQDIAVDVIDATQPIVKALFVAYMQAFGLSQTTTYRVLGELLKERLVRYDAMGRLQMLHGPDGVITLP